MARLFLKAGRERSLLRRHPWVFSGAVERVDGDPESGETVEVIAGDGSALGRGAWSPRSQIAVRMWTFDPEEEVDGSFIRARVARAVRLRRERVEAEKLDAYRVIHAESDGLPGVTVDRYAGFLVCRFTSAGAERRRGEILDALGDALPSAGVYERSDGAAREKEGLERREGPLAGSEPPETIKIREGRCRFLVDVRRGHKTGFYLDQRENRAVAATMTGGAEVLNAFAYTGAFAVACVAAGAARATNLESSRDALETARRNAERNGIGEDRIENLEGDVFEVLRRFRDSRRSFDAIVLDPPRFVEAKSHLERAARAYKDINLLAFKLLRPGGLLFTFSCSALMEEPLFRKVVAGAALDSGREVQVLHRLGQPPDHPVSLAFPEGNYLKGLVCRVAE
ncbi:MAG: class I SAM-dependent methyltransferase [Candidatus Eisenbacteria bacterium]|nr:class I SAM-dependent methyltransferase [Candidatus Eisenbacteria bacterium]